ncbi:MAG TPA: M1 family metallopeptidase, partial [Longimicrobiales bacterium]|nr:M1 family metallopeptidase [Longimicrobiales bacterium]
FAPHAMRATPIGDVTGGLRITQLNVDGQAVDLAPRAPGRAAEGAAVSGRPVVSSLEHTVAQIQLPTAIAANAQATLDIEWSFRVAKAEGGRGLRHGAWGDSLFQVAQWFPRVAAYDDLRGWDTDPYLGPSEFYNNFGSFDVKIDVPAGFLVGATGVLQNPQEVLTPNARTRLAQALQTDSTVTVVGAEERGPGRATAAGERLVWHFRADSVNDFAWAASSRYVWRALRAEIPGRGIIPVHILHTINRTQQYEQVPAATRHALEFYSQLWLPYAFPQHTVVDGPEQGMEYPMLIMSGLGAADHEVGHQWWPMMVGVNETWYGWMDEGFNVYMNTLSRAHREGKPPVLDGMGRQYGATSGMEQEAPLMWNANYGGPMYRFQAYQKAPLMLSMLGGIVGDTAVWRAMSDYSKAWAFKHPSPWDFAFFMNRALGQDLGWFWYSWLFTTDAVDGSIRDVRTADGRTTVTVHQAGQMPAPVVLRVELEDGNEPIRAMPNARMLDATSALVTFPVDVWFGGSRTYDAVLDFGPRRIRRIVLDPYARFPDRDADDNVWTSN